MNIDRNISEKLALFFRKFDKKAVIVLFFVLCIYGFFVFGIESNSIRLSVRIIIVLLFVIFLYFRYKKFEVFEEMDNKRGSESEKQGKKDDEIIKKLADQFQVRKKDDSEAYFKSHLNQLLFIVNSTFVGSCSVIYLVSQGKNTLVPKGKAAKNDMDFSFKEIDINEKIINEIFEKRDIIKKDELSAEEITAIFDNGNVSIKSSLGAPIFIENEIIGILAVFSDSRGAFSDEDKDLIRNFTNVISNTIINYNTIFESESSSLLFSSFYEISKGLNSNLKFDETIDMLINIVKKIFEYDRISLSLVEDNSLFASIKRVVGQVDEFEVGFRFPISEGLNGWVIRKNKPILVSNLEKGEYFIPRYFKREKSNYNLKSFISAPIGYYNKCLGVITIESRKANIYGERHENVLVMLANNIGVALERNIIYQRLESEATTDELTRLYNYRAFKFRLSEEINRAKRYNQKFCLLMMDIDHFKNFNDQYGHLVGDEILKSIGKSIKSGVRNMDFVARYGGEEFVAILIAANIKDAKISAERVRNAISNSHYKLDDSEYPVTISIGVAEYNNDIKDDESLINRADTALYKAKETGRNRVVIYEEEDFSKIGSKFKNI
ncbi:diguanylate cyclase [candidate division KSB1 bacterium]